MRLLFSSMLLVAMTALASTDNPSKISFSEKLKKVLVEKKAARFELGRSKKGQAIEAWFFPGTSDKKALVIGGVHGSELSSIEVVRTLLQQLQRGDNIYYNVIVIPVLFPDNAQTACNHTNEIGSEKNIGRYSFSGAPDPNRQMPAPGQAFDELDGRDPAGRKVEEENVLLLQLIDAFKPQRIASVHAIRNKQFAGFFADPRTDENGFALGYATDSCLAVAMAAHVKQGGGQAPGNMLGKRPNALYYKDPVPVAKNEFQKRNITGSPMPGYKGNGISLGTWAATAVKDINDSSKNRDAIRIITIEFPGSKRPLDYTNARLKNNCQQQVRLFASAIRTVFLHDYCLEGREADL